MKKITTALFLLISLYTFAQKTDADYSPAQYKANTCHSSFIKIQLEGGNTVETVSRYLKEHLLNLKDYRTGLKLNYRNESPGAFHYSFTQTFNGVAIYQSEIKVNVDRQNTIHSIFDNSENTSNWNLKTTNASSNSVIVLQNDSPVLCRREIKNDHSEVLISNGEIIFERDMNSYFAQDSLVSGKIFRPDPLTSSQQNYGGLYADHNDSTNAALDSELQTVNFTTTFTGSQFVLENNFVRVRDFDAPTIAPATSAIPQFYFDRSQSGFEDVNAFFHINAIRNHIHALGFGCADSLIDIDTHAVGGADNSYFSPISLPHRVYYGIGCVDDAEDADVCVHEYGHSVSETASPGSNNGSQRNSVDEAFCDYLAGSYSKSISAFNDTWVFNWDGHNECWNGRVLNSSWVYPTDLGSMYHNAQIWSAVLWCVNGAIGSYAADSLVLQSAYSFASNMSFTDAAQLLLDADTLLTGGKYTCPIYSCLFYRGLAPNNPLINCNVGIQEEENFPLQFMDKGNSFTLINPNAEKIQLQVLNTTGALLWSCEENQPTFNYHNTNLASGIYLVTVHINNRTKTFKWSKLN